MACVKLRQCASDATLQLARSLGLEPRDSETMGSLLFAVHTLQRSVDEEGSGEVLTFGAGLNGQLGHGGTENEREPRRGARERPRARVRALQVASYKLLSYTLQVTSYKLQATSYKVLESGIEPVCEPRALTDERGGTAGMLCVSVLALEVQQPPCEI